MFESRFASTTLVHEKAEIKVKKLYRAVLCANVVSFVSRSIKDLQTTITTIIKNGPSNFIDLIKKLWGDALCA